MDVKTLADKYFRAWEMRDLDAIMALHTPDTIFCSYMGQETVTGSKAVREVFAGLMQMIPDISFKAWDMRFGEDFWVAQMIMSGTRRLSGGADTGISTNSVDVIQVREGLVFRKDSYVDSVRLFSQLGSAAA